MGKESDKKGKLGKTIDWGVGAFDVIMKSKLVSIGCFLYTGFCHLLNPRGSLRWTAGVLALCLLFSHGTARI